MISAENDKKRLSGSDEAANENNKRRFPASSCGLAQVRSIADVMGNIYSFLPVVERVRLGEIDSSFLSDEHRGMIVGVYGDSNVDLVDALKRVREWIEYDGSPWSLTAEGTDANAILNDVTEDFSDWYLNDYGFIFRLVQPGWFDEESGYDLSKIETDLLQRGGVRADIDKKLIEIGLGRRNYKQTMSRDEKVKLKKTVRRFKKKLVEALEIIDFHRTRQLEDLAKVEEDAKALLPHAPYSALFHLMKKHDMSYEHFLEAEEPPLYGFSDNALQVFDKGGSCNSWSYMNHVRPSRKFIYKDSVSGEYKEISLKKCRSCKKITEGVQDESCSSKYCGRTASFCRKCTRFRTCATCGRTGCACRFDSCCADGCKNVMCNCSDFYAYKLDEAGEAPGCSFVVYEDDVEPFLCEQNGKYCEIHKPEGSTPFTGMA